MKGARPLCWPLLTGALVLVVCFYCCRRRGAGPSTNPDPRAIEAIKGVTAMALYRSFEGGEKIRDKIIARLRQTTSDSLKSPVLAAAWTQGDHATGGAEVSLFLICVEAAGSVDGVRLTRGETGVTTDYSFDKKLVDEMRRDQVQSREVVYMYLVPLGPKSAVEKADFTTATLLRAGVPVSNAEQVHHAE